MNRKVLIFIFCFVLTFSFSTFLLPLYSGDEVWCYGFSYNIYNGLIPYKDFSMLLTPFYFYIGSVFIKIFGEYLFSMHIFSAIFISLIMLMLYEMIGKKSVFIYPFLLIMLIPSYNFLCLFFLFLIIYLNYKEKYDDLLSGFIVGLIFITKQSIGITMLIPLLYYSKKKVKSFLFFLIPICWLSIYLVYKGAFFDFIDHCFLGMLDFSEGNKMFGFFTYIEIIQVVFIIFLMFKKKFRDKILFYILSFQIVCYPIFEAFHWLIAFIPFLYYVCIEFKVYKLRSFSYFICFILFLSVGISVLIGNISNLVGSDVVIEKNTDNYLFLRNVSFVNKLELDYQVSIMDIYSNDYNYQFLIMRNSYLWKLYMKMDINKFDLINNGNMGYKGDERIIGEIKDICEYDSCIFFVENDLFNEGYTQVNKKIYNYVIGNYFLKERYEYFNIYTN